MKDYKVEALRYYQKSLDPNPIVAQSKAEIQAMLDEYASKGYRLTSTTSINLGGEVIYLFFEKDN